MEKILLGLLFLCLSCTPRADQIQLDENIPANDLFVKDISQVQSEKVGIEKVDQREKVVLGIFEPTLDPYIGEITLPEKCSLASLPKPTLISNEKEYTKIMHLYSSAERSFGNCTNPKSLLKTLYQISFCKGLRKVVTLTYYYDQGQPWREKSVAHCP